MGYHDHNWGNVGPVKVVHVVSFTRTHDLSVTRMVDTIKGVKRIAAKLRTSTALTCDS